MNTLFKLNDSTIVSESKTGMPVIKVLGESGKWVTLHSMIDPVNESKKMTEKIVASDNEILVVLGLGMGYHLFEIINRFKGRPVAVIEKNEEVLDHFLSYFSEDAKLKNNQITFITTDQPDKAIEELTGFQMDNDLKAFRVIEHVPSMRAYPAFYADVSSRIRSISRLNIRLKLNYPRFKSDKVKVLILHSKYYLLAEMINSIKSLGHEQRVVMVKSADDGEGSSDVIEDIISEIIEFKPDFVLTVNHLGFDREGYLTDFFSEIKLPYASWYIDSPLFILDVFKNQISDYLTLFLWDRDYIDDMHLNGFNHVFYLPLATDLKIFKSVNKRQVNRNACDVGFVGSSWLNSYNKCLDKIGRDKRDIALIEKLSDQFIKSREKDLEKNIFKLTEDENQRYQFNLEHKRTDFIPAVTWRATQKYRLRCVKEILPFKPHIHGDPGWKNYLNGDSVLLPELNYYDELPQFYQSCKVNFNTTAQQMKNGINQRIFDVPATKSFILTDYQAQLEEHFEIGKEVVCYKETGEIRDLICFYLKHDLLREKIVQSAYHRIEREHTYKNRMEIMVNKMKEIYA